MKSAKKITILTNWTILVYLLFLILCPAGLVIAIFWYTANDPITLDAVLGKTMFVLLSLCIPLVISINPDRCVVWLTFTPENIEYHVLFRKKRLLSYSDYPYIMRGGYLHVVYPVEYIVLSNRRLKDEELHNINNVTPSAMLIRIRYSDKVFRKMVAVFPEKQSRILRSTFFMHPIPPEEE